ncbi:MAG: AAA family ATPase [Planctomycetes bacterium]|nr:AAA family ATPase [Planctomycetota bacterium]
MRTVAIANQKGGCGKTTVVINLAACLARENQRTLVVDLDPQGHCALGLAVPEEQIEINIADALLSDDGSFELSRVTWQISTNYDLVPSKTNLAKLEATLAGVDGREKRLRRLLDQVRDKYDIVLLDTPPNIGFLTQSALYAADEIIVPVDTGYFSLHGLSKQLDTIREMRSTHGLGLAVRILANLYDVRTKLGREILAELRKRHGDAMFTSFINFNTKLKESTSLGQPITEYDPASSGCKDFLRFARELISVGPAGTTTLTPGLSLPSLSSTAVMPARSVRVAEPDEAMLERAEALAADANKLLATTETLLGSGRIPQLQRSATPPTPAETDHKIDLIYGAQAISDGAYFVVRADRANSVRLAGDFNAWNPTMTPMQVMRDGIFHVKLPLAPGRYRYRYVVDGRWMNDPANHAVERNPYGELDSVVTVN